jgi:hypothetical protein
VTGSLLIYYAPVDIVHRDISTISAARSPERLPGPMVHLCFQILNPVLVYHTHQVRTPSSRPKHPLLIITPSQSACKSRHGKDCVRPPDTNGQRDSGNHCQNQHSAGRAGPDRVPAERQNGNTDSKRYVNLTHTVSIAVSFALYSSRRNGNEKASHGHHVIRSRRYG